MQTLKHEALDHFMIFGEKHLNHMAREFVDYYHRRRPHQGKGNKLLLPTDSSPPATEGEVVCEQRLGGLLKHYYRKAA